MDVVQNIQYSTHHRSQTLYSENKINICKVEEMTEHSRTQIGCIHMFSSFWIHQVEAFLGRELAVLVHQGLGGLQHLRHHHFVG